MREDSSALPNNLSQQLSAQKRAAITTPFISDIHQLIDQSGILAESLCFLLGTANSTFYVGTDQQLLVSN